MRYKVYLDHCAGILGDTPIFGAGEPLAETDDLNDAHEIAVRCARDLNNGTIVIDDDAQRLWWYDNHGEEQSAPE